MSAVYYPACPPCKNACGYPMADCPRMDDMEFAMRSVCGDCGKFTINQHCAPCQARHDASQTTDLDNFPF